MIITRKVARWALLLKREALGRTYGAQKRSEQAPRGATAMLPRSGRVDDNIDTDTDTVATDLHRTSSCVALALPLLPFPYYYYRYYYPRAGIAASLFNSDRRTLTDHHEDHSLLIIATIDEPRIEHMCFDSVLKTEENEEVKGEEEIVATAAAAVAELVASSTVEKTKEQQDVLELGIEEAENVARPIGQEITVLASVDSNRLKCRNVYQLQFSA